VGITFDRGSRSEYLFLTARRERTKSPFVHFGRMIMSDLQRAMVRRLRHLLDFTGRTGTTLANEMDAHSQIVDRILTTGSDDLSGGEIREDTLRKLAKALGVSEEYLVADATVEVRCESFSPGQILMLGDLPELGNWDPAKGMKLKFNGGLRGQQLWAGWLILPPGQSFAYKFYEQGAQNPWEVGGNREYTVPGPGAFLIGGTFRTQNNP
jgi:hypothetical protein